MGNIGIFPGGKMSDGANARNVVLRRPLFEHLCLFSGGKGDAGLPKVAGLPAVTPGVSRKEHRDGWVGGDEVIGKSAGGAIDGLAGVRRGGCRRWGCHESADV